METELHRGELKLKMQCVGRIKPVCGSKRELRVWSCVAQKPVLYKRRPNRDSHQRTRQPHHQSLTQAHPRMYNSDLNGLLDLLPLLALLPNVGIALPNLLLYYVLSAQRAQGNTPRNPQTSNPSTK